MYKKAFEILPNSPMATHHKATPRMDVTLLLLRSSPPISTPTVNHALSTASNNRDDGIEMGVRDFYTNHLPTANVHL